MVDTVAEKNVTDYSCEETMLFIIHKGQTGCSYLSSRENPVSDDGKRTLVLCSNVFSVALLAEVRAKEQVYLLVSMLTGYKSMTALH